MQYKEEIDDGEVVYDALMQPSFNREMSKQQKYSHYSQWGPKRPRHTMDYPNKKSKCGPFRRCVCHPLSMTCTILLILLAVLVIAACMIFVSFYAVGYFISTPTKSMDYGPGDTQSLFFSTIFCEELVTNEDTLYDGNYKDSHLYLLKEAPSLSGETTIKFDETILVYDIAHVKDFHLFPGSRISIDMCAQQSKYHGFGSFYLVQGKENHSHWEKAGSKANHTKYVRSMHILNVCGENAAQWLEFDVMEEDQYYLRFENDKSSKQLAEIDANFTIERKLYSFNESSIIKSCQFHSQPCSFKVPMQRSTSVLLVYGEPIDWDSAWTNEPIDILCIPRIWLYTILAAAGVLLIALCTCLGCLICWCCSLTLSQDDEAERPLLGTHTEALYGNSVGKQNEMHNPTKFKREPKKGLSNQQTYPVSYSRRPQPTAEPHPPSTSRKNSFGIGTPSYVTFTGQ